MPELSAVVQVDFWRLRLAQGLCRIGHGLSQASMVLLAVTLLGLMAAAGGMAALAVLVSLLVALLAALGQLFWASRIALDQVLFEVLAQRCAQGLPLAADLVALDQALAHLGAVNAHSAERSVALRLAGLRRLVRCQGVCVAVQLMGLLLALALQRGGWM